MRAAPALIAAALCTASQPATAQTVPLSADRVAASMCLNVHNEIFPNVNAGTPPNYPYNYVTTEHTTTYNDQFFAVTLPAVKKAGVRCLRVGAAAPGGDGGGHVAEFQLRMKTENSDGFALDTVTGSNQASIDANFALDGGWTQAEGQNEPDKYQKCAVTVANQKLLWGAIKTDASPQISSLPVVGPSLTTSVSSIWLKNCPTFAGIADVGNWHPYNHANNPEAAGWLYAYFANASKIYPGVPIWATEYGLRSVQPGEVAKQNPVPGAPDAIIARYLPRVALTMLNLAKDASGQPTGFARTYWHQVADGYQSPTGTNAGYGVFFDYYGNPKPQGAAMASVIAMFSDPNAGSFSPASLSYAVKRVSGNTRAPYTMLFQKSDGSYLLPIWLGLPGWNGTTYTLTLVSPEVVTVQVGKSLQAVEVDTFNDDGTVSASTLPVVNGLLTVTVTDHLQVLRF